MRSAVLPLSLFLVLAATCEAGAEPTAPVPAPVHKVTQSESYIMIEPMYATIMDGERPGGMLLVAIGLDIPDPKLRAEAEHAMPVLRDAYVRSVISYAGTHVHLTEQPDVVAIADRLQRITDKLLRQKGAQVLLAQVAARVTN